MRMRKPRYSAFDLSHERKFTCKFAELIPCLVEEVLPGDFFNVRTEVMVRLAPMVAPPMHMINVYVHYFYVPNRIIWNEWEDFITGGKEGTTKPTMPTLGLTTNQLTAGSLSDYLGIQGADFTLSATQQPVSQLPYRAYTEIWNEYFRDETLEDVRDITLSSDIDNVLYRAWEKDYFTSALPWTQRGPEVDMAIDITYKDPADVFAGASSAPPSETLGTSSTSKLRVLQSNIQVGLDNIDSAGITINQLRESNRLQEFLENNARGGYRYIEQLLHRWGVKSSDARLQRPEYLGGGRQAVTISEVLNTSATATEPQGDMAGHGISVGMANRAKRRFEEHGWLIGVLSVLPRTNYHQGVPRWATRFDQLDYYHPEFAQLGEQAILNREIYYDPSKDPDVDNDHVFGYQQRFAEYKYGCSTVHAEFRTTLQFWTLVRDFSTAPALNQLFVSASNASTRIFADESNDHLWCQVYNKVGARRPMPYYSRPRL